MQIDSVHEDGRVVFKDGNAVIADFILHCTGYSEHSLSVSIEDYKKSEAVMTRIFSFSRYMYDFPFLETNGVVTVDDNRVGPLYKHVFPPELAPWLSFVGLPWKVVTVSRDSSSSLHESVQLIRINSCMKLMAGWSLPLV